MATEMHQRHTVHASLSCHLPRTFPSNATNAVHAIALLQTVLCCCTIEDISQKRSKKDKQQTLKQIPASRCAPAEDDANGVLVLLPSVHGMEAHERLHLKPLLNACSGRASYTQ